jgi:hypothetical protein
MVPAAHSTDSKWYAVDENGEVALFDTGEPGAVPLQAGLLGGESEDPADAYELFYMQAIAVSRALDAEALEPLDPPTAGHVLVAFEDTATDVTTWDLVSVHKGRRLWTVSTGKLTLQRIDELSKSAFVIPHDSAHFYETEGGITQYGCQDYAVPGLYQREARNVLMAADLPEAVRAKVSKLKLQVKFAETESMQLADLPNIGELAIWGDGDARGNIDPQKAAASAQRAARAKRGRRDALIAVFLMAALLILVAILARK